MWTYCHIFSFLNWIQDFKPLNTVIFVDSLSALQAIKGSIYKVKNFIIYDIYNIFTSLSNIGINVILEWIPSHVGILGNELADKEAKNSLSLKNKYAFNPLYKENYFERYVAQQWDSNPKGRHVYGINKTVSFFYYSTQAINSAIFTILIEQQWLHSAIAFFYLLCIL